MSKRVIKFKKLCDEAVVPSYAHKGDLGLDVTAIGCDYNADEDSYSYHTGLALESDMFVGDLLFTRSSNGRTDAYLVNHVGLVDSASYRGEIIFKFKNRTSLSTEVQRRVLPRVLFKYNLWKHLWAALTGKGRLYLINLYLDSLDEIRTEVDKEADELRYAPYKIGERIGQMVFTEFPEVELVEVDELSKTDRGTTGFGKSGK